MSDDAYDRTEVENLRALANKLQGELARQKGNDGAADATINRLHRQCEALEQENKELKEETAELRREIEALKKKIEGI